MKLKVFCENCQIISVNEYLIPTIFTFVSQIDQMKKLVKLVDDLPKIGLLLVTIYLISEPVLFSCGQYKCAAALLGIDKIKILVKMM